MQQVSVCSSDTSHQTSRRSSLASAGGAVNMATTNEIALKRPESTVCTVWGPTASEIAEDRCVSSVKMKATWPG